MNALEELDAPVLHPQQTTFLVYRCGNTYKLAEAEHDRNLIALMERAQIKDIRFNLSKLRFRRKEMKVVGHILTQNSIKADPEKTSAILSMPAPHDRQSLLRFIAMIKYLSSYCQNLSTVIETRTQLTRKKHDIQLVNSATHHI